MCEVIRDCQRWRLSDESAIDKLRCDFPACFKVVNKIAVLDDDGKHQSILRSLNSVAHKSVEDGWMTRSHDIARPSSAKGASTS